MGYKDVGDDSDHNEAAANKQIINLMEIDDGGNACLETEGLSHKEIESQLHLVHQF